MAAESLQRVRIYLREGDQHGGQPLYQTVLDRLQRDGAAGATVLKGLAGFGMGRRSPGRAATAQTAPLVIEWVDRAERVARIMITLDELLPEALVTLEEVQVHRASIRADGLFGERHVRDYADRAASTATAETTVAAAVRLLLQRPQPALPVLDSAGRLLQLVTPIQLERAGALPLNVLAALPAEEREPLLAALPARTLSQLSGGEPRAVAANAPIASAVRTMVEWSLDALPVTDREGRFAGLLGVAQALQAALDARGETNGPVQDPTESPPLSLLMQRNVASMLADAPADKALTLLLMAPDRFVVVLNGSTPIGLLRDDALASQLPEPARALWRNALATPGALSPALAAAVAELRTGDLPLTPLPTIAPDATRDDAARRLLAENHEWLVVVTPENRLAGLVGRRTLLRSLAQESAA